MTVSNIELPQVQKPGVVDTKLVFEMQMEFSGCMSIVRHSECISTKGHSPN